MYVCVWGGGRNVGKRERGRCAERKRKREREGGGGRREEGTGLYETEKSRIHAESKID